MSAGDILRLHDVHLLEGEMADPASVARLRKLGLTVAPNRDVERERERCIAAIDRRWLTLYDRAHRRYGRGVVAVRDRVCGGCRITLPTSAAPSGPGLLTQCESCARILYWG